VLDLAQDLFIIPIVVIVMCIRFVRISLDSNLHGRAPRKRQVYKVLPRNSGYYKM
jgi:hypothetical protein